MKLTDIHTREDLYDYYNEHKLNNIQDKFQHLYKVLKLRGIRGELLSYEEELDGLESIVLSRLWEWADA